MFGFPDDGFTKLPAGRYRNYRSRLQGGKTQTKRKAASSIPVLDSSFFLQPFRLLIGKSFHQISAMSVTIGQEWQSEVSSS